MKKVLIFLIVVCSIFSGCSNKPQNLSSSVYKVSVDDIVINKSHAYLDIGDKLILLAQVFPFNADNQNIIWISDNDSIASVSNGIVIGKGEGRTIISAISEDGGYSTFCTIFVSTPKLNYKNYLNNLQSKAIQNFDFQNSSKNKSFLYNDLLELEDTINEDLISSENFYNLI